MDILESFINWIKNVAEPIIDLYNKDSNAFFIGAIVIILVLLILVIALARRAEESDDKPKKKIKYEDIDWSVDGEDAEDESDTLNAAKGRRAAKRAETSQEAEPAPVKAEPVKVEPAEEVPVVAEPVKPEPAPVEEVKISSFDVPMWMTKHTISIDQANSIEAQEWVDQQLAARHTISQKIIHETERHAAEMGKLALEIPDEKLVCIVSHEKDEIQEPIVERAPHIVEDNVFVVSDKDFEKYVEPAVTPEEPKHEPKEEPITEIATEPAAPEPEAQVAPEPVPEPEVQFAPEPVSEPEDQITPEPEEVPDVTEPKLDADQIERAYESGTLAKILKEAEELKASENARPEVNEANGPEAAERPAEPLEVDKIIGLDNEEDDGEKPSWNIQETLKRLEAMQNENESMARDIGIVEEIEPEVTEIKADETPSVSEVLLRPNTILPVNEELESNLKQEYEQMLRGDEAIPSFSGSRGDLNDSIDLKTRRIRRFGPDNKDTNRSGRKFTEEELIRQIRD